MNVIIIKTDQQRFDTLSCMGNKTIRTPNIDRLAERGTVFQNAFCCSTLCVPSRVSFFTGQYVHRTQCTSNAPEHHISIGDWSFLEALKENGYTLGLAGKNHAFHDSYLEKHFSYREEYGHWGKTHGNLTEGDKAVSQWLNSKEGPGNRMPNGMLMEGLVETPLPFPKTECPTWRIAQDAIRFIDQNRNRSFFLHCSFPDPHFPNTTCEPYYSMYLPGSVELENPEIDWSGRPFAHFVQSQSSGYDTYSKDERKKILSSYYGQIHFIDDAIGSLVDAVEERGLLENTLFVFTSDHGDFAGRYGLIGKTKAFYEVLIRVPLIIVIPNESQVSRSDANISNIDVMPTAGEVLGLKQPEEVQGQSFLGVIRGDESTHRHAIFAEVGEPRTPPPPIPIEEFPAYSSRRREEDGVFWFVEYTTRGRSAMIRKDGWKYCYYTGDREELYHIEDDPSEINNLASVEKHAEIKDKLKSELLEWSLTEPQKNNVHIDYLKQS